MLANAKGRWIAAVLLAASFSAKADLELPTEVAEAFSNASTGESGGLFTRTPEDREILIRYVKSHWKELLDHLDEVPRRSGSIPAVVSVVGVTAEELPPVEYVDFLKHYLTVYARGVLIRDDDLWLQFCGDYRKNRFVTMNYSDPRVYALLLRAKELVPKKNVEFQKYLDDDLSGKRAGWFYTDRGSLYVNVGDGITSPPELLPGGLLRRWIRRLLLVTLIIVGVVMWKVLKKRRAGLKEDWSK